MPTLGNILFRIIRIAIIVYGCLVGLYIWQPSAFSLVYEYGLQHIEHGLFACARVVDGWITHHEYLVRYPMYFVRQNPKLVWIVVWAAIIAFWLWLIVKIVRFCWCCNDSCTEWIATLAVICIGLIGAVYIVGFSVAISWIRWTAGYIFII